MHLTIGRGEILVHLTQTEIRLPRQASAAGGRTQRTVFFTPDDDVCKSTQRDHVHEELFRFVRNATRRCALRQDHHHIGHRHGPQGQDLGAEGFVGFPIIFLVIGGAVHVPTAGRAGLGAPQATSRLRTRFRGGCGCHPINRPTTNNTTMRPIVWDVQETTAFRRHDLFHHLQLLASYGAPCVPLFHKSKNKICPTNYQSNPFISHIFQQIVR